MELNISKLNNPLNNLKSKIGSYLKNKKFIIIFDDNIRSYQKQTTPSYELYLFLVTRSIIWHKKSVIITQCNFFFNI
jgi:hypothetical protein